MIESRILLQKTFDPITVFGVERDGHSKRERMEIIVNN